MNSLLEIEQEIQKRINDLNSQVIIRFVDRLLFNELEFNEDTNQALNNYVKLKIVLTKLNRSDRYVFRTDFSDTVTKLKQKILEARNKYYELKHRDEGKYFEGSSR